MRIKLKNINHQFGLKDEIKNPKNFYKMTRCNFLGRKKKEEKEKEKKIYWQEIGSLTLTCATSHVRSHNITYNDKVERYFWIPRGIACANQGVWLSFS
jgi:hypothetical protein